MVHPAASSLRSDVVIVGGGHAGAQAAIALRQQGFSGSISIISREEVPPYERPPLSKDYLLGDKAFERILIRPAAFWNEKNVRLELGVEATRITPEEKVVHLSNGDDLAYGSLIWAAGGTARQLRCPGADLEGIFSIRDKDDVDRIRACLAAGAQKAVIIGGGYVGLEAASAFIKMGIDVTLLELLPRVLARVAGEPLSRFFEAEHRSHGVKLMLATAIAAIDGQNGRVANARLETGEIIDCDVVVVGVGLDPSVAPLREAGAKVTDGVEVDEFCRTNLESVFAIGDCARHPSLYAGGAMIRLESVQNANDMANNVAKFICGRAESYKAIPWFFSNQYDLRLQTAGLAVDYDDIRLEGSLESRSFTFFYLRDGDVIASDCVNSARDFAKSRKEIQDRALQ